MFIFISKFIFTDSFDANLPHPTFIYTHSHTRTHLHALSHTLTGTEWDGTFKSYLGQKSWEKIANAVIPLKESGMCVCVCECVCVCVCS